MKFSDDRKELLARGDAPVRLEPVNFSMKIDRKTQPKIMVLDHSGKKTDRILSSEKGWINLDGANQSYLLFDY